MQDYLVAAVLRRDPAAVAVLCGQPGVEPNASTPAGEPLLNVASRMADAEIVRHLLAAGADPELTDHDGRSALHRAALGDIDVVRLLIAAGAKRDRRDRSGQLAIDYALTLGKGTDMLRLLVPHDLAPEALHALRQQVLVQAATSGDADGTRALMAEATFDLRAPLAAAVRHGHGPVVKLLLAAGAPLDAADASGACALHHAAIAGKTAMVELLLDAGADPHAQTRSGDRAAHHLLGTRLSNTQLRRLLKRLDAFGPEYLSCPGRNLNLAQDALRHSRMLLAAELGAAEARPDCDGIAYAVIAQSGRWRVVYRPGDETPLCVEEDIGRGEWYPVVHDPGVPRVFDLPWLTELLDHSGGRPGCAELVAACRDARGGAPTIRRYQRLRDTPGDVTDG